MLSDLNFFGEAAMLALRSAGLMFLVGLLAWAVSNVLDKPIARWVLIALAMVGLVGFHGWDVWFQSEPASWMEHVANRDRFSPSQEQGVKLIWVAFWGGVVGLVLAAIAEGWFSGSWGR